MQWLHRWSYFENELEELKIGVALIVRNSDKEAVRKTMEFLRLDYPVVFDKNSMIKWENIPILARHSVFVVDGKKEVIWLGSPTKSRAAWNAFRKTIRQRSA